MLVLSLIAGCGGVSLVVWSLADLFQSVIVPRSTGGGLLRPSALISRSLWKLWRENALRIGDQERREDTLALFAPAFLMLLLGYWVASQIVGYGLLSWALRAGIHPVPSLPTALYFAGTSMLTIGYGDYAPVAWYTRIVALFSAAAGLGTFAVVTTFLFQTFGAFQRREAFVVAISERTGAPPSGLEFVLRHLRLDLTGDLDTILRESQHWIAEVMETHLAYPVLTYFRSSHDDESWVGTLGALLDASTLLITTLDVDHRGQAELTHKLGSHLARDFSAFFRLPEGDAAGVDYPEFVRAYEVLRDLAVPLHPLELAWPDFARRREAYAAQLDAMARWWRIPPAHWIGDRSRVRAHVNAGVVLR